LEAKSGRETKLIEETKSFSVTSELSVVYKDNWQPVLENYPDFPREAEYHRTHDHAACAAAPIRETANRGPIRAVGTGHFKEIVGGIVLLGTIPPIIKALESPDRP